MRYIPASLMIIACAALACQAAPPVEGEVHVSGDVTPATGVFSITGKKATVLTAVDWVKLSDKDADYEVTILRRIGENRELTIRYSSLVALREAAESAVTLQANDIITIKLIKDK